MDVPATRGVRLGGIPAFVLLCLGVTHCGNDVLVGINRSSAAASIDGGIGEPDAGARASLVAVRRLGAGTHVAGGWIGCASPAEPSCDGWLATTPGSLVEEARVSAVGADVVHALALIGDDRVLAGVRTPQGVGGAWVARRTPSGPVWELSLSADPARPSDARAVENAPDGTLVVGGNDVLADGAELGWVARVSVDGALVKRSLFQGTPSANNTTVDVITTLPNNVVYIGGRHRETVAGVEQVVPTVLQLGADLTVLNSKTRVGIAGATAGRVRGLLSERASEITACAQVDDGVGVVRMWDYLTDVHATRVLTEPGERILLGGCVVTDDARIVLVGTIDRPDGARPWAAKIDRVSLEPIWTRIYDAEVGRLEAVAPAIGGGALAVGTSRTRPYFLAIAP